MPAITITAAGAVAASNAATTGAILSANGSQAFDPASVAFEGIPVAMLLLIYASPLLITVALLIFSQIQWAIESSAPRIQMIRRLRRNGRSIKAIASFVGCSPFCVRLALLFR